MSTFTVLARALVANAADALAPRACAACDERVNRCAVLCPACAVAVVRAPPRASSDGDDRIAFALFGGPLAVALRRLKYGDRPDLAGPLGHLLRQAARSERLAADVVIPVPLHPARLAERGYNQAALLGAALATELDVPLAARALARTRHTLQQARLARRERLTNVVGAFRVRSATEIGGRRVLLIDDVATTGATLEACAMALREAGARSVTALVVAQADSDAAGAGDELDDP